MATTFRCSIVTPSAAVFDADVRYVSFPAWDGQQGVLPGQSPLLARLGIGRMSVEDASGGRRIYLVDGGFAQIQDGALTILTERAATADELSLDEAEMELAEANKRAVEPGLDRAAAEAAQQRARAKRALAASR